MVSDVGRRVSIESAVDAELEDEDEPSSAAVVNGIAGGRIVGAFWFFIVGKARRRSDILMVLFL